MPLAIISDIHGNWPALQAVLSEIDRLKCEQTVSLGDVCGYYCFPNECIDELRAREITNVMGNHDGYIAYGSNCPRSNSANRCLEYQRSVLKSDNKEWVANSKLGPILHTYGAKRCSLVHGGWNDPLDEYFEPSSSSTDAAGDVEILFSGHSHRQNICRVDPYVHCNPGSVGQPRDGDARAAFAVLTEDGAISLHRVIYDIDAVAASMKDLGFEERFYINLYHGRKIGQVI